MVLKMLHSNIPKFSFQTASLASLMFDANNANLLRILTSIETQGLSISHIESKLTPSLENTYILDLPQPSGSSLSSILSSVSSNSSKWALLGSKSKPWIPRVLSDLDKLDQEVKELPFDNPGFSDKEYWDMKESLLKQAQSWKVNSEIPKFEYTIDDLDTWKLLFNTMTPLYLKVATSEYIAGLREMKERGIIKEEAVPQLGDISAYLQEKTRFQLKPIASISSPRDFLSCLAFRVFPTSVHMRHHSNPYYSMDIDLVHFALGHAPMLACEEFADFVHEIGLASLGATDEELTQILNLYHFTVEHGLKMNFNGEIKVLGARILNSIGEIKHSLSHKVPRNYFCPGDIAQTKYIRKSLQSSYWFFYDFKEALSSFKRYAAALERPYWVDYVTRDLSLNLGWRS